MKTLGIDEAGRGPVIGPMVLCGYLIDDKKINALKSLHVKDSKLLSPSQREGLFGKLKKLADDYLIVKIPAKKLNELMKEKNLNQIEIDSMAKLINFLHPEKVIIDSPEVNTDKFSEKVRRKLDNKNVKIISENYADKKYPIVSAASILAKVIRDREIEKIRNKIGEDFGSGYPSDEKTSKFLEKFVAAGKKSDYIRNRWITYKRLKKKYSQGNLRNFGDYDGSNKKKNEDN